MTLREIIENPDRWGEFLRTVSLVADSNKGIDNNRQHSNQKGWDKLLADYEEYLHDVENTIRVANARDGHVKSILVRNIAQFRNKVFLTDEIKAMRKMKYRDYEIDAIRKYFILKNFFSRESEQIKDGKAVVNDRIKNLIASFEVLKKYCLSVSTEGEANVGNNETLSQKRKQRTPKKELEWNKIECPNYEELISFYENNFNDEEKKELEGYIKNKNYDIYYFIVKSYICDVMKLDMSWWITSEMFVEGTVEHSYYKNFIERQKQPWEK